MEISSATFAGDGPFKGTLHFNINLGSKVAFLYLQRNVEPGPIVFLDALVGNVEEALQAAAHFLHRGPIKGYIITKLGKL